MYFIAAECHECHQMVTLATESWTYDCHGFTVHTECHKHCTVCQEA